MIKQKLIKQFIVATGSKVDLKKFATDWTGTKEAKKLGKDRIKQRALRILEKNREELAEVQELTYANNTRSVLLILQAMDAAGKDGTIRHVMSGVNPQGCQVFSFKKPSDEELNHNFLWRYMRVLPERGREIAHGGEGRHALLAEPAKHLPRAVRRLPQLAQSRLAYFPHTRRLCCQVFRGCAIVWILC